jgi:xylan 1,4-beta-xylosidase|uniref:family 43 glycosylhydrolase n=1 Tax=Bacteroides eggerthii TaxID=28111 RepID=UPI003FEFA1DE
MKAMNKYYILLLFSVLLTACEKTNNCFKTICNPVNLSYRFSLDSPSWREAADPSMIKFKDEYYLFLSKSGGYFHSTDLIHWNLITTDDLPIEKYAPTVMEMNGEIYFTASIATNKIYKSRDPKSGKWELVTDQFPYILADPMLFYDSDNDKVYLYYGSGAATPMMGMELDKNSFMPKGEATSLFYSNAEKYGWEVSGDYNTNYKHTSWLEGAWMNKYKGKYYLQYAVPGTEFKSYSNGVYVSEHPLGPFTLLRHNPFSYKPEGFVNGIGHGSTFQDIHGNYWNIGTSTISKRHMFERRVSLYPVFFDKDGDAYAYTAWGDYPMIVPDKKVSSPQDLFPEWMLLSYKKEVETSSTLEGYPAANAVNEDIRTWWSAKTADKGEFMTVDLGQNSKIYAIQINFADQDAMISGKVDSTFYQYRIEDSQDGITWNMTVDKSENKAEAPNDYIQLDKPVNARYVRITNIYFPSGKFSISGLRVFGKVDKPLPAVAQFTQLVRSNDNRRTIELTWNEVNDATGYNIRFGTDKDKLYHNYLVYQTNKVSINILNADQTYYFTIDSFNEAGVTKGKEIKIVQ